MAAPRWGGMCRWRATLGGGRYEIHVDTAVAGSADGLKSAFLEGPSPVALETCQDPLGKGLGGTSPQQMCQGKIKKRLCEFVS